jgi:hypothetical protein
VSLISFLQVRKRDLLETFAGPNRYRSTSGSTSKGVAMPLPFVWLFACMIPLWCAGAVLRPAESTAKAQSRPPGWGAD